MGDYTVGLRSFKTKKQLQEACKVVLNGVDDTKYLSGEDFELIDYVLKMHQRYTEKVGKGSYKLYVQDCPFNPKNRHFMIEREDGSEVDFSYYKSISGFSLETRVKTLLRYSIEPQSKGYKSQYFKQNKDSQGYVRCAETGLKIKKTESHLDHYPLQFEEIVYNWFMKNKLKLKDLDIQPKHDNGYYWEILNEGLADDFIAYHRQVATYRVVLAKVNLQRSRAKIKLPK